MILIGGVMRAVVVGIGASLLAWSSAAIAQQCSQAMDQMLPTLSDNQSSGGRFGLTGYGFQCNTSESYVHFQGSRGAFSDAQKVTPRWTTDPFNSTCSMRDPSG